MRQAIFIAVIIAAAFLGGAVINGPGLRWIQSRLLDYMGLRDGGEITSIDLPPTLPEPLANRQPTLSPIRPETTPELTLTSPSAATDTSRLNSQSKSLAKNNLGTASELKGEARSQRIDKATSSRSQSASLPGPAPPRQADTPEQQGMSDNGATPSESAAPPLDPSVGSALLAALTPTPSPLKDDPSADAIVLEVTPSPVPPAPSRICGRRLDHTLQRKSPQIP